MRFVVSRQCSNLFLCLLFVLTGVHIGWAEEGDPVVDKDGDVVHVNGKAAQGQVSMESMTGPVQLPSGVKVGRKGVVYSVKRDELGRIARLDDAAADGYLVEYRRPDETPGVDVWRKDGTYTWYDFYDTYNTVSQGRFGQPPEAVMTLDRETGEQITRLSDGTVVTARPADNGNMAVSTQLPGRSAINSVMSATGELVQGTSRVVTDDQGRPTDVYLGGHRLTSTRYDDQGHPVEITLDGGGRIRHTYNEAGRLIETEDMYGGKTRYEYDPNERIVKTILPDGAAITQKKDAQGNVIESVGPGPHKTVTSYAGNECMGIQLEGLDDQVYVTFDDGTLSIARSSLTGTWVFSKDTPDSLRIKRTDPLGQSVTFAYNTQGQLEAVEGEGGKALLALVYDEHRNIIKAVTPETAVELTYDDAGHILTETTRPVQMTVTYGYDAQGVLNCVADSKGHEVLYTRDDNGQLSEIKDSQAGVFKLTYGAFALPVLLERPNGVKTRWQYDPGGRLVSCTHTLPNETLTAQYTYDVRGQLSKIAREPGEDTAYAYDSAGHWTKIEEWGEVFDMEYDAWGQIVQYSNIRFGYDEAGRMNQLGMPGSDIKIATTSDKAGRMAACEIMGNHVTYQYNWDHQLVLFNSPDSNEICTWTYDGLGRLASSDNQQKDTQVKQQFVYAAGQLYGVQEEGRGLDCYIMIPGTNQYVAVIKQDGTVLYPLWDYTGSIDRLTDKDGNTTGSRTFRSIGAPEEEETMPIAIGYRGGLAFVNHTLLFVDGHARFMGFHRAAAAPAPWPNQSSLRENSPFIAPAFEVTR